MRFLADESCDVAVIVALRTAGHDVEAIAEEHSGAEDALVIDLARREKRILVTEDKDFGQLYRASSPGSAGVVLLRFPGTARSDVAGAVVSAIDTLGTRLESAFTVIQPGRIRIVEGRGEDA